MTHSQENTDKLETPQKLQQDIEQLKDIATKTISSNSKFAPHYLPSQIEEVTGLLQTTDETITTLQGNTYEFGNFVRVLLYKDVDSAIELYNTLLIDFNVSHKNRSQTVAGDQLKKAFEKGYTLTQIREKILEQDNPEDLTDSNLVQLLWDLQED